MLLAQTACLALSFARDRAGNSIAVRIAMMATTTSSSIKVKAARSFGVWECWEQPRDPRDAGGDQSLTPQLHHSISLRRRSSSNTPIPDNATTVGSGSASRNIVAPELPAPKSKRELVEIGLEA